MATTAWEAKSATVTGEASLLIMLGATRCPWMCRTNRAAVLTAWRAKIASGPNGGVLTSDQLQVRGIGMRDAAHASVPAFGPRYNHCKRIR